MLRKPKIKFLVSIIIIFGIMFIGKTIYEYRFFFQDTTNLNIDPTQIGIDEVYVSIYIPMIYDEHEHIHIDSDDKKFNSIFEYLNSLNLIEVPYDSNIDADEENWIFITFSSGNKDIFRMAVYGKELLVFHPDYDRVIAKYVIRDTYYEKDSRYVYESFKNYLEK